MSALLTKNLFLKGQTSAGAIYDFQVDPHLCDLKLGVWRSRLTSLLITLPLRFTGPRVLSFSFNFDLTSQHLQAGGVPQQIPLVFGLHAVNGRAGELVDVLQGHKGPFLTFQSPPAYLCLTVKDEQSNAPFPCSFYLNLSLERMA